MSLIPFNKPFCTALSLALACCAPLAASAQGTFGPGAADAAAATTASDALLGRQYQACMDSPGGGSTAGMVGCIGAETKRQDTRLNQAYKAAMAAQQTPERKKQLQSAQRAWLKFRDANCAYYNDPDGGTLARVSANDCVMRSTAQRASELEGFGPGQ